MKKQSNSSNIDQPQLNFLKAIVIGPRAAGKSTYVSGLTQIAESAASDKWKKDSLKVIQSIKKDVGETREFWQTMDNIVRDRERMVATTIEDGIKTARVELKVEYQGQEDEIIFDVSDTSGELFENNELDEVYTQLGVSQETRDKMRDFKKEEFNKRFGIPDVNILILLDDFLPTLTSEPDTKLLREFQKLTDLINMRKTEQSKFRIAVVMNKCERGELWTHRLDPFNEIFDRYLKKSTNYIKTYVEKTLKSPDSIQFFAMSTFGVLDSSYDYRPNHDYRQNKLFLLRDDRKWHPYGMLSPIYWLATGRRLPRHV